jgi:hypothetical protein
LLRAIRRHWLHSVFDDILTGKRFERYELLPTGRLKEVLVYQCSMIAQQWDEKGADPSLRNTMIHLLLAEGNVTAVIDDPADHAIRPLLESLRTCL